MPLLSDISKHREEIADLADRFAIKNFVLGEDVRIPPDQLLDESLIFDGFMLTICLKGKAKMKINYKEFSIQQGEILTYLPNQIFRVKDISDDFIMESLFLSSEYVLTLPLQKSFDLLKKISVEPVKEVSSEAFHNMLEFHSLIAKFHRREDSPFKEPQTKALIYALLMEVSISYSASANNTPAASRQELLTDNFFKLMLEEYKNERSVAYYADRLCLTPKYLSMTVKKITGHPISDWINEAVIIEAKRMLKATDLTALQISEELNFPNPSFFGRFFKQYTGITPLQYKNGNV